MKKEKKTKLLDRLKFQAGDIVTIKPEWRDNRDKEEYYLVREWNGDRGYISLVNWTAGDIVPTELVRDTMIEHTRL
jgi:hypothetical protein